jgi:hypothetical protein
VEHARYGWGSDFPRFRDTPKKEIRSSLQRVVYDASPEQVRAWDACIPRLQQEVAEVLAADSEAAHYTTILEYELPMESRRPDAIFLVRGGIVVVELKGKTYPSPADLDQAAAYARDLRCYHREATDCDIKAVLVPTRASGNLGVHDDVHVIVPDALDGFLREIAAKSGDDPIPAERFLSADAYRPLPTLVKAARELFERGDLREIHRARASTDPAVQEISRIIHDAARTKTRRLVLLTGVPGAGKTLVGLRVAHAHFLDDLAVPRSDGKPTAPAVFLSGNGPLVQVLQYQMKGAGGDGKTFVRGVKEYVKRYSGHRNRTPPEHVLIFDEAQRAYDAEEVQERHKSTPGFQAGRSEPEHFIEFADRVPEWCVVIGLIGSGQEIHIGEEAGLGQWRVAVETAAKQGEWAVHGPPATTSVFSGSSVPHQASDALNLDRELRFHAASDLHEFVSRLLLGADAAGNSALADRLRQDGYRLRLTRDLGDAKAYLRERYAEDPEARFGLLASSRDRDLERFGVENGFNATKQVRFGPWYGDSESTPGSRSCRHLVDCVTEFGAQGLELDSVLLAWGTDLIRQGGKWSSANARRYQRPSRVKDAHQLRINAYRVLLTRGRDATIVFVPLLSEMDETYEHLRLSGFGSL